MGLAEIKKFLEDQKKDELSFSHVEAEITSKVDEAAGAEKKKSLTELSKLRKADEKLRGFRKTIAALGYDVDGDETLEDFETRIKDAVEEKKSGPPKSEMEKLLHKQGKQIEALLNEKKTTDERIRRDRLRSSLSDALKDKVLGVNRVVSSLIADGEVGIDDDGETIFFKEGDDRLPLSDGVSKFLEKNKELALNGHRPGAGSLPGAEHQNRKTISRKDFEELSPQEKMSKISEGVVPVD